MLESGATAVAADEQVLSVSEVATLKKRIAEPERVLGKKTMENEVLRAAVAPKGRRSAQLARRKTALAAIVRYRGLSIGIVASALAVSRSNLYEHPCDAPGRSHESNGMAEAFVKTLKRDYASCNRLTDSRNVIAQLKGWVEDYNEYAPHKGLNWLLPRQYRRRTLGAGNFPGAARVIKAA